MATRLASDLYAAAAEWQQFNPDYAAIAAVLEPAGVNRAVYRTHLIDLAVRTPTVICVIIAGQPECIWALHTLRAYPKDMTDVSNYDNGLVTAVTLCGNDIETALPIVLHDNLGVRATTNTHTLAY